MSADVLSLLSDWSYNSAVAVYILAMLFFLVEQSFGVRSRVQRRVAEAGVRPGDGPVLTSEADPPNAGRTHQPGRAERFGSMAASLLVLGVLLHFAAIALRGLAAERAPWGNMYEFAMVFCFVGVVTWLVLIRKYPVRHLSAFVLLPLIVLMFIGGTLLYTNADAVQPALQSYWLVIHVAIIVTASGMFLIPGVASVLYLVRAANEHNPERLARLAGRLPDGEVLDRIAYRTTVLAFPLFTVGVLTGAIWAEAAWGRFWAWDPKEVVAFISWVVYAGYLHARATAGWRGSRAAAINVAGFATVVFNLFFVNLVIPGLHSYSGLV